MILAENSAKWHPRRGEISQIWGFSAPTACEMRAIAQSDNRRCPPSLAQINHLGEVDFGKPFIHLGKIAGNTFGIPSPEHLHEPDEQPHQHTHHTLPRHLEHTHPLVCALVLSHAHGQRMTHPRRGATPTQHPKAAVLSGLPRGGEPGTPSSTRATFFRLPIEELTK